MPMWSWGCHLETTLFQEHGRGTWLEMREVLNDGEQHFILMETCTTKTNRSFLLVCPHCLAACRGKYGHNNPDPDATQHAARLARAKFLLNQNVLVEGPK